MLNTMKTRDNNIDTNLFEEKFYVLCVGRSFVDQKCAVMTTHTFARGASRRLFFRSEPNIAQQSQCDALMICMVPLLCCLQTGHVLARSLFATHCSHTARCEQFM